MPAAIEPAVPDLTPEEFSQDLATPGQGTNLPITLTPATDAVLKRETARFEAGRSTLETGTPTGTLARLGKEPGVPLESGVDPWTYLQYRAREDSEDQMRFLSRKYGEENIRINELGKPVVRTIDPKTGKPIDRTVDPFDLDITSPLAMGREVLPIAATGLVVGGGNAKAATMLESLAKSIAATDTATASYLTAKAASIRMGNPEKIAGALSKIPGFSRFASAGESWLFKSLLGASTYEAVKAVQDAGMQAYDRPTIDLTGIIGHHAAQVPLDVTMDAAAIGGTKTVDWAMSLLSGKPTPTPVESLRRVISGAISKTASETEQTKLGKQAMDYFAAEGVPYKPTIGEISNLPAVAKTEEYLGQQASGATAVKRRQAISEESNRAIQRYIREPGTLPLDEEVGRRGTAALSEAYQAADDFIKRESADAAERLNQTAQKRLLDYFSLTKLPERGYPWPETGDMLTSMGNKSRDAWTGSVSSKYAAVYNHPDASIRNFSGDALADYARKTKDQLISAVNETEKVGYDAYGSPVAMIGTERVPLKSLDITGVIPILDDLSKLKGSELSVLDLKHARTAINDQINRSLALTDTRSHFLNEIADEIDGQLQKSIDAISQQQKSSIGTVSAGGPIPAGAGIDTLRSLWDDAVSTYRDGVGKFKDKLIAPLWAKPDEMLVRNDAFMTQLMGSDARYKALVNFFGEGSDAVNGFRDTVKKKLFADNLSGDGRTVDAAALLKRIQGMATQTPQLYNDVIQGQYDNIFRDAKISGAVTGRIDLEDLDALMRSNPHPGFADYEHLASMEAARGKLYQNAVVKKFIKGDPSTPPINPEDFVRYLPQSNVRDVNQVMSIIESSGDPDLLNQLRRKTLQDIFYKASRNASSLDIAAQRRGDNTFIVSLDGLQKVLATDEQKAVYKRILGPDKFEQLENYVDLQHLPAQRRERARGTGLLASGESTSALLGAITNPLAKAGSTITEWAKLKALSVLISTDWGVDTLKALEKTPGPPIIGSKLPQTLTSSIITSQPFVKAMAQEFTDPFVRFQVMSYLKRMSGMSTEPEGSTSQTAEQFRQSLQPPPMPAR